jgi:hypothetical protein
MIGNGLPTDVVLALIRVINGDAPLQTAEEILDSEVQLHMDTVKYSGIDTWCKWIHLLRNCGRVRELRMVRCNAWSDAQEPSLVHLSARWTGTIRSARVTAPRDGMADYLVQDGRITQIWTHKSNYDFIFGRWIGYSIFYRLFILWSVLYFGVLWLLGKHLSAISPGQS